MKKLGFIFDVFIWLIVLSFIGVTIFLNYKTGVSMHPAMYLILFFLLFSTIIVQEERRRNKKRKERLFCLQKASLSLAGSLNLAHVFEQTAASSFLLAKNALACMVEQIAEGIPQPRYSLNIQGKPDNTFGLMVKEKEDIVYSELPKERPKWSSDYKYFIGIPLTLAGNIIGTIELYFKKKHKIGREEKEALITLSSYAASSISNASQYEETSLALQKEKQAFIALSKIDKSLKEEVLDLEDQLNIILKEAFRASGAMKSEVWVFDEEAKELSCITVYPLVDMVYGVRCKMDEGLLGEVLKSNKPISCPDLTKEPRFTNPLKRKVISSLFIPLIYQEKNVGVMALFNKNGNQPFTDADLNILEGISTQAAIAISQTKMYYKLKNLTAGLVSLYEINRTLAEGKELNNVLQLILKKGCELFSCDNGSIMLLDEKTNELTIKVASGLSDEIIRSTKKYVGDGSIAGWVAKERKPLILLGRVLDERFSGVRERTKDSLCVPMITKNRLIGVFSLSNRRGQGIFEKADMDLLATLANEAGLAIETAILYDISQKRIKELLGIKRIAGEMMLRKDIKEIIGLSLNIGCELLECEFGWFFESKEGTYVLISARGKGRMDERDFEGIIKTGDDTVKWIGENKKPLIIDKCEEDPRFSPIKTISCKTLLGIPVISGENLLGVIEFFNKEPYFTKDDVRLGLVFANQMAIAIENASLFLDIKKKALELSTVNQMVKEIASVPNLDELCSRVISFGARVMRSKKAWFHLIEDRELILKGEMGLSELEKKREGGLNLGKGIAGVCALEKEVILVSDVKTDKRIREEDKRMYKPTSYISCPIVVKDEPIGVLSFSEKLMEADYNEDDLGLLTTLSSQVSMAIENIRLSLNLERHTIETFKTISAIIETRDPRTRGYSEMVEKFAEQLAKNKELSEDEIKNIASASYLIDIGKIGIPEEILLKDERFLNPEEVERLKQHPIMSVQMLRSHAGFKPIIKLIYHHHENYDGTGYPDGISGEDIPIGSRIIAISDNFSRLLKQGRTKKEGSAFLQEKSGSYFDPELVSIFINSCLKEG
ncbi:MAG: GAF domain-containing protein [bacterium]